MCRWVFYYGDEVCISKIIYGAYHGLANMADGAGFTPGVERDIRRNHEVNVHGCGIGWYGSNPLQGLRDLKGLCSYSRPCCYTTIAAPSHDRNLRSLSKAISTSLLFGHVRAAGPGASVHEYNCHPFYNGRYMFMHNGEVHGFKKIRRSLLATLRDDLFEHISGTTDSEVLFALVLNQLPDTNSSQSHEMMERAVREAMCLIIRASGGKSSSMNLAFTDGETVVAARYRNSSHEDPPSLYFHLGPLPGEKAWDLGGESGEKKIGGGGKTTTPKKQARGLGGFDKMMLHGEEGSENRGVPKYRSRRSPEFMHIFKKRMFATQSMLVSSEPLSMNGLERWQLMPPNSLVVTHPMVPTKGRCSRKEFLDAQNTAHMAAAADGNGGTAERMSPKLGAASPVLYCEFKCLENLEHIALNGEGSAASQSNSPERVLPHGVADSVVGGEEPLPALKSALSSELLQQSSASSEPVSPSKVYVVNERDSISGIAHALEKQGLQYSDSESESLYSRDDAVEDAANRSPTPKSKLHKTRSNERNINSPNKINRVSIDSADCIPRPQRERHHRVPQYGLVSLDEEGRDLNRKTDTPSPPIHYGGDGVIISNDSQQRPSQMMTNDAAMMGNLGEFYSPAAKKNTSIAPAGEGGGITMSAQKQNTVSGKIGLDLLKQTKRGESSSYSPEVGSYFGMLKQNK